MIHKNIASRFSEREAFFIQIIGTPRLYYKGSLGKSLRRRQYIFKNNLNNIGKILTMQCSLWYTNTVRCNKTKNTPIGKNVVDL